MYEPNALTMHTYDRHFMPTCFGMTVPPLGGVGLPRLKLVILKCGAVWCVQVVTAHTTPHVVVTRTALDLRVQYMFGYTLPRLGTVLSNIIFYIFLISYI